MPRPCPCPRRAGCKHENVTVEAGKTYLVRLISAASLLYQVRALPHGASQHCQAAAVPPSSSAHTPPYI